MNLFWENAGEEVIYSMAKAGMRRPNPKEPHGTESNHKTHIPKNDAAPVPEIQGKAKSGKKKAGAASFLGIWVL